MKWYDVDLGEGVSELPYKRHYLKKRHKVKWKPKKKKAKPLKKVRKKRHRGILRRVGRLFFK